MDSEDNGPSTAVRRPNETIAINPTKGKITLGTRRLFNLLLYFSQQDGVRETYSRPISEVMALLTTSKDSEWLKNCFRQMQETAIEWNNKDGSIEEWGISGLISEARIITAGNSTTIAWSLPNMIRERLMDPRFYTKLTLEIHSKLTTGASIALYEICARYLTNPSKVTNREHWEWWQPRLTGNSKRDAKEYKYFSRETLRPAIAEVNQVSDIIVALIEHKNGRKIEELQFRVTKRSALHGERDGGKEIDEALLESIIRFGVSQKEARALCASHGAGLIARTVALTEQRLAASNLPAIRSAAAFFKKALTGEYANSKPQPVLALPPATPTATASALHADVPYEDVQAKLVARQIAEALKLWEGQGADEQLALLREFRDQCSIEGYRKDINRRGRACIISVSLRTAFSQWYAQKTRGALNDQHRAVM